LNTPDAEVFAGQMVPGSAAADAPLVRPDGSTGWLLPELGQGFSVLVAAGEEGDALARSLQDVEGVGAPLTVLHVAAGPATPGSAVADQQGLLTQRYDLRPGTVYLFRPDHHVTARWRKPTVAQVKAAIKRALAIV
jgi:3-(3-hydroxy-phenyl)propionate hydroxylase